MRPWITVPATSTPDICSRSKRIRYSSRIASSSVALSAQLHLSADKEIVPTDAAIRMMAAATTGGDGISSLVVLFFDRVIHCLGVDRELLPPLKPTAACDVVKQNAFIVLSLSPVRSSPEGCAFCSNLGDDLARFLGGKLPRSSVQVFSAINQSRQRLCRLHQIASERRRSRPGRHIFHSV